MTLTGADLLALLPLLVLGAGIVVVMLVAAFTRSAGATTTLAVVALLLACAALVPAARVAPRDVTPLLTIDAYALFFMGLNFAATIAVALLAHGYFARGGTHREAFVVLLLLAAFGSAVLVASSHFASFVLGLEVLSVALFALVAYTRDVAQALEAGIKYLILAGLGAAFVLFGIALVFAGSGSMAFADIGSDGWAAVGLALILVGIGFKLALVPFHMWTPDIYQGAPAPVSALIATVSKGAMLALLLRLLTGAGGHRSTLIVPALSAIAIASILAGNLLALLQDNVKRILAYSSIAQLGYLLIAVLAAGGLAIETVGYYLAAYYVAMLGAFGVVTLLSAGAGHADLQHLADYRGLAWRRPWLAAVFTIMLLSLAGIPLTMGFVAKFYVVAAGVDSSLWLLVIVLVIGSAIGLVYALRIIATLIDTGDEPAPSAATAVSVTALGGGWTLAVLTLLILWLGITPQPLMRLLTETVARLV